MEEIKIAKKLEALKGIKPSQEWVLSAKKAIVSRQFEKEAPRATFASFISSSWNARVMVPTFAGLAVMIMGGSVIYTAVGKSLPGESLFAWKQTGENIKISMLSSQDQSVAKVAQAESRLNELDNITKQSENQGSKLAAGITEAKRALSVASKELSNIPDSQKAEMAGQIVGKISKIEKATNASIVDGNDSGYAELYKTFAENQIQELANNESNLTAEQKALLKKAKEAFAVEDYTKAVEYIYQIQPQGEEE